MDNNVQTILAHQLYQYESNFDKKKSESKQNDSPISILNKIKDNP